MTTNDTTERNDGADELPDDVLLDADEAGLFDLIAVLAQIDGGE